MKFEIKKSPGVRFTIFVYLDPDTQSLLLLSRILEGLGNIEVSISDTKFISFSDDDECTMFPMVQLDFFYPYEGNKVLSGRIADMVIERIFENYNPEQLIVDRDSQRFVYTRK